MEVWYQAQVSELDIRDGHFNSAKVERADEQQTFIVQAQQIILASGGFQSNIAWLREVWGQAAENLLIRGTEQNTGEMLAALDAAARADAG